MNRFLAFVLAPWVLLATAADAQDPAPGKQSLRLLFLGAVDSPRGKDFAAFLGEHFAAVAVADRWTWNRALLQGIDVVVLDWSQEEGIAAWSRKGDKTLVPKSPLGARRDWTQPTVLIGSAGINTAWAWDVRGSWG